MAFVQHKEKISNQNRVSVWRKKKHEANNNIHVENELITENGPCELFTVNNAQCMVWNQYWGNMRKHNIFLELYVGEFCNSDSSDHDNTLTKLSLYIIHLIKTCCHFQHVLLHNMMHFRVKQNQDIQWRKKLEWKNRLFNAFERSLTRLHLFDQKYSKNVILRNIMHFKRTLLFKIL